MTTVGWVGCEMGEPEQRNPNGKSSKITRCGLFIFLGSARRRPYPYCGDYYDYHRDASINGAVRRSPNGTINPDNQLSAVDRAPVPVSLLRFSMLIALAAQLGSPNSSATVCGGASMSRPEGRA